MPRYVWRLARTDGKPGPRIKPVQLNCAGVLAARFGAPPPEGSHEPECAWRVGIAPPVAQLLIDGAPMPELAGLLERLLRRKVVDATGLKAPFHGA